MGLITINNKYVDTVTWNSGELCDLNITGQADIWQINIDQDRQHISRLLQVLEPVEIARADKYHKASDRNRFITSRGSLRHILSAYLNTPAPAIRFGLEGNKKPFITYPAASQLHFNLSDSAGKILIAIAGTPVGIDIELIKPAFRYHDILTNNFSLAEGDYINLKDSYHRFFMLWTRKESILKATGIGLTDHLKQVPSIDGLHKMDGNIILTRADWELNSFEGSPDYVATIASKPNINLRFWNFIF